MLYEVVGPGKAVQGVCVLRLGWVRLWAGRCVAASEGLAALISAGRSIQGRLEVLPGGGEGLDSEDGPVADCVGVPVGEFGEVGPGFVVEDALAAEGGGVGADLVGDVAEFGDEVDGLEDASVSVWWDAGGDGGEALSDGDVELGSFEAGSEVLGGLVIGWRDSGIDEELVEAGTDSPSWAEVFCIKGWWVDAVDMGEELGVWFHGDT